MLQHLTGSFFSFLCLRKWTETNQRGDGNDKRKSDTFSRLALWSMFSFTTNSRLLSHTIWSPSQRYPPNKYVQMHLFLFENSDIYLRPQLKTKSKTKYRLKKHAKRKVQVQTWTRNILIGLWFSISGWLFCVCVCFSFYYFSFFPAAGMIYFLENCYSRAW